MGRTKKVIVEEMIDGVETEVEEIVEDTSEEATDAPGITSNRE